jgi:CRP/FNR family transcriptional regulator, cyclic AMP receptor protein
MNPDAARLRALPLFADLDDEECERLSGWIEEQHVEAGRELTPEGAAGYTFFVVEEGSAEVRRDGEAIRDLGPGDFFGEIAILDGGRRTASVVAVSPMRLLVIFGADFRRLETELPGVAAAVKATMDERLRGTA